MLGLQLYEVQVGICSSYALRDARLSRYEDLLKNPYSYYAAYGSIYMYSNDGHSFEYSYRTAGFFPAMYGTSKFIYETIVLECHQFVN